MKPSVWSCLAFPLLLVSCAWAAPQAGGSSSGDDGGYEMQDLSPKTLTLDRSCRSSDASRITNAFSQALDIAQSGISTIDWLLIEYADSSDTDEKRRLSMPLKTMAGDGTALRLQVDAKRKNMQDLRGKSPLASLLLPVLTLYFCVRYLQTRQAKDLISACCSLRRRLFGR